MAPQSPSPVSTAKTITPEDLEEQATTALADSHLQLLRRYGGGARDFRGADLQVPLVRSEAVGVCYPASAVL
jgi:hypothetical protein